jgi:lipopolysaccharide transport system ATP-binding protein
MSDIAIRCEGLGKQYRIGERESYRALRDSIADTVRAPFRLLRSALRGPKSEDSGPEPAGSFWALKDVSFEIKRGEVVGVIGRNGAGKSTLLKILSRITAPSEGEVDIRGRVGSLLEVGTGFHPELTGRENIYLNGAILGMRRAEIERKFDEMVAFAEVEKFIDTPVKRYSSGMYVRLAFAVAAHMDSDILLVDEVLAVGDAAFQKKCLGKMGDVARQGRTVLFVSHNMGAMTKLCPRSIWLQQGGLNGQGATTDLIHEYMNDGLAGTSECYWSAEEAPGDNTLRLVSVRVCQPASVPCAKIDITKPFEIEIETRASTHMAEIGVGLRILTSDGITILQTSDQMSGQPCTGDAGRRVSICRLPAYALNVGKYFLSVAADVPTIRMIFATEGVLSFSVEPVCPLMGRYAAGTWGGYLGPGIAQWTVHQSK